MKCPHCTVTVHCKDLISPLAEANVRKKNRIDWEAHHTVCPHCGAKFQKPMKFCGECGKAMA